MNNEFLKQLYWGKVTPWERNPGTSEMDKLNTAIDADILLLKEKLSDEDKKVLERLISNLSTLESEQICRGYVNGFKHGALMIMEVLSSDKLL